MLFQERWRAVHLGWRHIGEGLSYVRGLRRGGDEVVGPELGGGEFEGSWHFERVYKDVE